MKKIIILLLLTISLSVQAQKDTTSNIKQDTLVILVPEQYSRILQDIELQLSKRVVVTDDEWKVIYETIINSRKIIPNTKNKK